LIVAKCSQIARAKKSSSLWIKRKESNFVSVNLYVVGSKLFQANA